MAEKHIANKENNWRAVNTSPDFCKVGASVVPFDIFRDLSNAIIYSPNVYARGVPVLTVTSRIKGVVGDTGSGVASQVSMGGGDVIITSGSPTVNTNKLKTAYNTSDCVMNVGGAPNCVGKVLTEQGAPAGKIKNGKLPCNDPPQSSPKLEELKKLQEKLKSEDPREILEFIRTSESEQVVQSGIDKIQTSPDSFLLHMYAGEARALLGVANRFVFGLANLAKMGAQELLSNPVIDAMRRQVDADILAENLKLGNCTDQRTLWDKIKQGAKQLVKPITEPWSKGEYAESVTAGGLEALISLGPVVGKVGEISEASRAARAAELTSAADVGGAANVAEAEKLIQGADSAKVVESTQLAGGAKVAEGPTSSEGVEAETASKTAEPSPPEDGVLIKGRPSNPSYIHGQSDGGPGEWGRPGTPRNELGAEYQQQVTGAPPGTEYKVPSAERQSGYVEFDGYDPKRNVLLDAKEYNKWPVEKPLFLRKKGIDKIVTEAGAQVRAAKGTPIEWHVPTQTKADEIADVLADNNVRGIQVVVTPKQ